MNKYQAELERFRSNPDQALAGFYREHRQRFVLWAKGWSGLSEHDLAETFQDAVIIFWNKIRENQLTELTAAPDTYVFGVGKRLIMTRYRQQSKTQLPGDDLMPIPSDWEPGIEHYLIQNEEHEALSRQLEKLGEPCYTLLRLAFYELMRSAQIAKEMQYASEDVVRTQKKRCLDRLRAQFRS
ncbi:MAG: sigma-70 family RNA polymerase sigma factor [Lewinellaceae bacterium]|nr:sigma-70 family RNA polymerase sigma factor [Lewinellaceae bacterium]